jgi:concanavalin A-like lectin/glucanase superfamily protein/List-Bact-rpt repeat protein
MKKIYTIICLFVIFSLNCNAQILSYSLNESSGNILTNLSGTSWNGVVNGGAIRGPGKYSNGLVFDGVNDYVSIGDLDLTSFTIEFWLKQDVSLPAWGSLIMKQFTYGFEINTTTLYLSVGNGSSWSGTVSAPITLGQWTYVAGTFNGSTLNLYINGILIDSRTATLANSNLALLIGSWTGSSEFFQGTVDEVRIYNTALTSQQILSDLNTPVGGTPIPSYTLNINTIGNGSVTKNPDETSYLSNSIVQLTALSAANNKFVNWSENNISLGTNTSLNIVLNTNKTISAQFKFDAVDVITNNIQITWNYSTSTNVIGYNLYRANLFTSNPIDFIKTNVGLTNMINIFLSNSNTTFYVTAFSGGTNSLESDPSNFLYVNLVNNAPILKKLKPVTDLRAILLP